MGSFTKINSIEINLTDANNEVGTVASDGFSISEFIGEFRDAYRTECWPFPEESASLGWWPSSSCTRNIDADGTNDSGLHSRARGITSTNGLNSSSSIIPSQSGLNSPTAIDQEKERNTDIADNAVVVNVDVNYERSQNDDQRDNAVVENEDVNCERSQQDAQRDNAVEENEDVNCERSQKDDQTGNNALVVNEDVNCERSRRVTRSSSQRVPPPLLKTYGVRNRSKKNAGATLTGNKRAEKQPDVEQVAVPERAARVEDAEPEESESRSLTICGAPSKITRKSRTRRPANPSGTKREEINISRKSLRSGQKRKSPPGSSELSKKASTSGAASRNASKSVDSGHGGSEPTENGFDKDPIKGKKKNLRSQVDEELDPDFEVGEDELDSDFEVDEEEEDADPYPPRAKRTKRAKISRKKRATPAIDPSNKASSSAQPPLNENETVPSPPREQRAEETVVASEPVPSPPREQRTEETVVASEPVPSPPREQRTEETVGASEPIPSPPREQRTEESAGNSLGDQLASDGHVRKPNPPVNERQGNNRARSREVGERYVPLFSNPSTPNTGRGLGTGWFGSSNNQRNTPSSTQVAAQSTVQQKSASIPNASRGHGIILSAFSRGSGSSSNNNNNQRNGTPPSTVVAAQPTMPQKDASTQNTGRWLGTRPAAIGFGSSSNNNLRNTPPSTVVAAQPPVPHKGPSVPNTGRGQGAGWDAIYLSGNSNNNNLRSTPPSTVVAARSSVPQRGPSVPNTGRGQGAGWDAIYLSGSSNNNNLRSTPPSRVVAAQFSVPQMDTSIPNTGRGLGTTGATFFNNNNNQRSTPSSTQVAAQYTVPQKDAFIPNTGRGQGTGHGAFYFDSRNSNNNNLRSTPPSTVVTAQSSVQQKDASTPNTGLRLGTGHGAFNFDSRNSNNNNLRSTPPSTVVTAQSSVQQKDASVSDRKGKGVMFQSHDETERTQEVPQKPKTPFLFDLNETYEEATSLEDNTNAAREEEDRVPVISEQNSVEMFPPMHNSNVAPSSVMPPPVQERRRSSIPLPSHNPQWMGNVPMATSPYHHPSPSTHQAMRVTSLEDNTNAAREEEDRVPVRSEQNSVEMFPPRHSSYVASSSVMPPPVQERRRSSILLPSNNPQWMGNVPMATTSPYHHPSPPTHQAMRVPPHHYSAPSPPVWASPSMMPPQYHHHFTPPAPINMDYPSMFAQAPSSETWDLGYLGAMLNQAMMSHMDPRFRSNTPVDHHGNFVFPPIHVHPVNQFNQVVEVQRSHERAPVYPRTMSNQRRFQQRRNAANSSNASTSRAVISSDSYECIVNRYPGEITDIEPYMMPEQYLRVPERIAEFEQDEDQVGPFTESG